MTEDTQNTKRQSPPGFKSVKAELGALSSSYDEGVIRVVYEMIAEELYTTREDHFATTELAATVASRLRERRISIVYLERIVEEIARVLAPGAGFVKARMRDYRGSLQKIIWRALARRIDPACVNTGRMARDIIALIESNHMASIGELAVTLSSGKRYRQIPIELLEELLYAVFSFYVTKGLARQMH